MNTPNPSESVKTADDPERSWQALPQRLRGRGQWLLERGRIKDAELMFDAATEIDGQRAKTRSPAMNPNNEAAPILLNNWAGETAADVFEAFDDTRWSYYSENEDKTPVEQKPKFVGVRILLASYGTPSYEGYAFVLFERDGKLYEVNGSHCSCYGLEGQWEPEETTVQALLHRINEGRLGEGNYDENPFAAELEALLRARSQP